MDYLAAKYIYNHYMLLKPLRNNLPSRVCSQFELDFLSVNDHVAELAIEAITGSSLKACCANGKDDDIREAYHHAFPTLDKALDADLLQYYHFASQLADRMPKSVREERTQTFREHVHLLESFYDLIRKKPNDKELDGHLVANVLCKYCEVMRRTGRYAQGYDSMTIASDRLQESKKILITNRVRHYQAKILLCYHQSRMTGNPAIPDGGDLGMSPEKAWDEGYKHLSELAEEHYYLSCSLKGMLCSTPAPYLDGQEGIERDYARAFRYFYNGAYGNKMNWPIKALEYPTVKCANLLLWGRVKLRKGLELKILEAEDENELKEDDVFACAEHFDALGEEGFPTVRNVENLIAHIPKMDAKGLEYIHACIAFSHDDKTSAIEHFEADNRILAQIRLAWMREQFEDCRPDIDESIYATIVDSLERQREKCSRSIHGMIDNEHPRYLLEEAECHIRMLIDPNRWAQVGLALPQPSLTTG